MWCVAAVCCGVCGCVVLWLVCCGVPVVESVRVLGWVSVTEPREIAIIAHLFLVSDSVGSCASLVDAVSNPGMSQLGLSFVTWLVIVGGGGTVVG